jgi:hypothetical protein
LLLLLLLLYYSVMAPSAFVGDGAVKDVPSASALEVLFFAVLALLAYPVLPSFSENIGTLPISLRFSPTVCLDC